MRTILLAILLGATGFVLACRHEDPSSSPAMTSADLTRVALWDAGPSESPSQGWDNTKSNQAAQPPESILKNTGSR
jgi:hypothetical protein